MAQLWILVAFFRFLVGFLLILGTNRLLGHKTVVLDGCLASALGSFQAAVCTVSGFAFLGQPLWHMVFLVLSAWMAFRQGGDRLRRGALFVLLQLAMGQIAMGNVWPFLMAVAAMCLLCSTGLHPKAHAGSTVRVQIAHGGKQVSLTALKDTGNTLIDPISGCRVLVVDSSVAWTLLGLSEQALSNPLETLATQRVPGLRLIPYHTVGQPAGMLLAIRPERILLDGEAVEQVVAFSPHKLGNGQAFQALAGGMV